MNEGEWIAELQHCKEQIGAFANGDQTPRAEAAKKLWFDLDKAQIEASNRITIKGKIGEGVSA